MTFDPNQTHSADFGIFGIPSTESEAELILIPVPWEATTSYGSGASKGPEAILAASPQLDFFDLETGRPYEKGIYMLPIPTSIMDLNKSNKAKALLIRQHLENGNELDARIQDLINQVNDACEEMNTWVYNQATIFLKKNKKIAILGGDHSVPLGALRALSEKYKGNFGILHIDAHADLRDAYLGFTYCHASIMFNVINAKWAPQKLIQVGIRDFCEDEYQLSQRHKKIKTHYDLSLKNDLFAGKSWQSICRRIVKDLPKNVYVSFDIDGLDPALCPHTGTPVPGGLSFDEARLLLATIHNSGRTVIGFDLCEVVPGNNDWDGNVGARILYKLCGWLLKCDNKKTRKKCGRK